MRQWTDLRRDARFWLSRQTGRPWVSPDWLSVNLTLRCNLKCSMCTTCYDAPELSTAQVKDLVDQAAAWGVRVFNPLGGEPFIRTDLEEILTHAARRDLHTTLTTNGTLIRADRAAAIARIAPEKLHLNISFDGPERIHDGIRGAGMFRRSLAGYRLLREADEKAGNPVRKICVNAILHRQNFREFEGFLDFLGEQGFSGVQVLNLFRNGTEKTADHLWFYEEHLSELERLCERLVGRPLIQNRPEDLSLIPRYYREGLRPLEAPCWAGWKELYVNADGTAIMCDGKLDFLNGRVGDTRQQTLRELWGSPEMAARRKVVRNCSTPCIQNCYLRRESDSGSELLRDALKLASTPLRRRLRALRPWKEVACGLTLELSDIPAEASHPRYRALLQGEKDVSENPDRYWELRDQGKLFTGRGFMGTEILARLLGELSEARLRFAHLDLRWRGDPLLHPELERVLETLHRNDLRKIRISTSGMLIGSRLSQRLRHGPWELWVDPGKWEGRGREIGARIGTPASSGAVVSWDGKLTGTLDDVALARKVGDVLHESFAQVWARVPA